MNRQLFNAARHGDVDELTRILALHPHLIDEQDDYDRTLLYAATINGHSHIIEKLVALGSTVLTTPCGDNTPMHAAAYGDRPHVMSTLIRLGSNNLDTPNYDNRTPLHVSASCGYVKGVETFLRLGSKAINIPDKNGRTPIHAAALSFNITPVVETLVQLGGADFDISDKFGRTPIYTALYFGSTMAYNTLKLLGADRSIVPRVEGDPKVEAKLQRSQIDEDKSHTLRRKVYFQRSLSARLLFFSTF